MVTDRTTSLLTSRCLLRTSLCGLLVPRTVDYCCCRKPPCAAKVAGGTVKRPFHCTCIVLCCAALYCITLLYSTLASLGRRYKSSDKQCFECLVCTTTNITVGTVRHPYRCTSSEMCRKCCFLSAVYAERQSRTWHRKASFSLYE